MVTKSGVYRIANQVNGTVYIGSSSNVAKRIRQHRDALTKGLHVNRHLQSAWNKYGNDSFLFEPLITCDLIDIVRREQQFMDAYIEHGLPIYNIHPSARSQRGFRYKPSEATRMKQSSALMGKKLSDAHRLSLRLSHMGIRRSRESCIKQALTIGGKRRQPRSQATKDKIRAALIGRPASLESREKRRGKARSIEANKKTSLSMIGIKKSIETRNKMSLAQTGRTVSTETREKLRRALNGRIQTLEHRRKNSIGGKRAWALRKDLQR